MRNVLLRNTCTITCRVRYKVSDRLTCLAASLMNCLAFSSHIAGTVITQWMSSSTAPSPTVICSASRVVKSSFNPFMMKAKIFRAFWCFPFTSYRVRSRDIYCKKKDSLYHIIHGFKSFWNEKRFIFFSVPKYMFISYFAELSLKFYHYCMLCTDLSAFNWWN